MLKLTTLHKTRTLSATLAYGARPFGRPKTGSAVEKRGMDERWLGGSAPDNCLLTASEQYDVVSHRRRFLPLPWPLFGAAFCLWALSGVPPTGVTGEHGHNGLLFSECLNQPSTGFGQSRRW